MEGNGGTGTYRVLPNTLLRPRQTGESEASVPCHRGGGMLFSIPILVVQGGALEG